MGNRDEYFECSCYSDEHRLVFRLDDGFFSSHDDRDKPELFTSVFIHSHDNILKRIWKAVKYVFGYKCKYGHFDCFLMKAEDAPKFQALLEDYIKAHNEWVAELKERAK